MPNTSANVTMLIRLEQAVSNLEGKAKLRFTRSPLPRTDLSRGLCDEYDERGGSNIWHQRSPAALPDETENAYPIP